MVVCVIVIVFLGLVIIVFCLMDGVDCSHAQRNTLYSGGFEAGVLRKKITLRACKKIRLRPCQKLRLVPIFCDLFCDFFRRFIGVLPGVLTLYENKQHLSVHNRHRHMNDYPKYTL